MTSFKTTGVVDKMAKGLREFDDSRGRCTYCHKLIFKGESWVITQYTHDMAHSDCEHEFNSRSGMI